MKRKKVNLGAIYDAHVRHEFVDHDVAATMKTTIRRVTLPEGGGASI